MIGAKYETIPLQMHGIDRTARAFLNHCSYIH